MNLILNVAFFNMEIFTLQWAFSPDSQSFILTLQYNDQNHLKQSIILARDGAEPMGLALPKLTQICMFCGVRHLYLLLWICKPSPFRECNIIWKAVSSGITACKLSYGSSGMIYWQCGAVVKDPSILSSSPHTHITTLFPVGALGNE